MKFVRPDDDSCWLSYLTPLSVAMLGLAAVLAVNPPESAPSEAHNRAPETRYHPPLNQRSQVESVPYVIVVLSAVDEIQRLSSHFLSEIEVDIQIVRSQEEEERLTDHLQEVQARRRLQQLPPPMLMDFRRQ